MPTTTWKNPSVSDSWGSDALWSGGKAPNSAADIAVIQNDFGATVLIKSGLTYTAGGVTLTGGTLSIAGQLNLSGAGATMSINGGRLSLSGVVNGGTVVVASGAETVLGNAVTLNSVLWRGRLTMDANTTLNATGSLRVQQNSGTTPGTIDMTAAESRLNLGFSGNLNNVNIVLGSGATISSGGSVTQVNLGTSSVTTVLANSSAALNIGSATGTMATAGLLTVNGILYFNEDGTFRNTGTMVLNAGAQALVFADTYINQGTIRIGAGAVLRILNVLGTGFTNSGSMTLDGGTLEFGPDSVPTSARLGTIGVVNGGLLRINGTFDLAGRTITAAAGGTYANVQTAGFQGGTVVVTSGVVSFLDRPTLDGVTWRGAMNVAGQHLAIFNAFAFQAVAPGSSSSMTLSQHSQIVAYGTQTFDNVNITVADSGQVLELTDVVAGGLPSLTLGAASKVSISAATSLTLTSGSNGDFGSLTLAGRADVAGNLNITATVLSNSGTISIGDRGFLGVIQYGDGATFTNSGSIGITGAGRVSIVGRQFFNTGAVSLGGGTLSVESGVSLSSPGLLTGDVGSLLTVFGRVSLEGGTLTLGPAPGIERLWLHNASVLANGVVVAGGGTLSLDSGATLDSVTLRIGTLRIDGNGSLTFANGLSVQSVAGDAAGTITVSDGWIRLATSTSVTASMILGTGLSFGQVTLDAGVQLTLAASNLLIARNSALLGGTGASILNLGSIQASYLSVSGVIFTNAGRVTVGDSGTLLLGGSSMTNAATGTITVGSGAFLEIGSLAFSNPGLINVNGGALSLLSGTYTPANLGNVIYRNGGSLIVRESSVLDIGGGTLSVAGGTSFARMALGGALRNGTVLVTSGTLTILDGALLDSVRWRGQPLTVGASVTVNIAGSLDVRNAAGTGRGTIDLTASKARLVLGDATTLSNVSMLLGGAGGITFSAASGALTFAGNTTVTVAAGQSTTLFRADSFLEIRNQGSMSILGAVADAAVSDAGAFINAGVITLGAQGLWSEGGVFSNEGTVIAQGGGTASLYAVGGGSYESFSGSSLLGGFWRVDAYTQLQVTSPSAITELSVCTVDLEGQGSVLRVNGTALETSLNVIGSGAVLVLGGRTFVNQNAIFNIGTIQLNGGGLAGNAINVASPATLQGNGVVQAALIVGGNGNPTPGTVIASGGLLRLLGSITDTGNFRIAAASTLEVGGKTSSNVTFLTANGRLILDAPTQFTGSIGALPSDLVRLVGINASNVTLAGGQLTVTTASQGTLAYTVTGPVVGVGFTVAGGNTDITFRAPLPPRALSAAELLPPLPALHRDSVQPGGLGGPGALGGIASVHDAPAWMPAGSHWTGPQS